jgi:hypothetical protein
VDLIGYVPYYSMNGDYFTTTLPRQLQMVNEVRYFGLTVDATGAVVPLAGSGDKDSHLQHISDLKAEIDSLPAGQRPRLDITLGGAGEAAAFSTIAADSNLRQALSQNINALLMQVGATSVDIDWEHPANTSTELNNYSSMVQRIKQEVGSTRGVYTAMTPERFMPPSAFQGPNAIDGVSLMTYDLGYWGNDPEDPYTGEHSLPQYVADSVDAWTKPIGSPIPVDRDYAFTSWGNDTTTNHLGVGLPLYGRDINTSEAVSYADLKSGGWTTTDGNYYMRGDQTVWIPGPDLAQQRVDFANSMGLKNIILWSLNDDLDPTDPASLLRRAYEANLSAVGLTGDYDHDGIVGPSDHQLWRSTFGSTSGDLRADGNMDGTIDAADYTVWRDHQTSSGLGASSVPEPSAAVMLLSAFSCLWLRHRFRIGENS